VSNLNSISKLKEKVKELEIQKQQSKGRVTQLLETLEEEFNCSSLKQAQILLKKKKEELEKLDNEYDMSLTEFMEKWGAKLNLE